MRHNGLAHFTVFIVFYSIFMAGFFNDLTDSRVMNMRYFWKQVMFYLEVQSSNKPAYQLIISSKIGCCGYLMFCPFTFNFSGFCRLRKFSLFNCMSQLKYDTNSKPCYHRSYEESNQPGNKSKQINWKRNHHKSINQFRSPKSNMFTNRPFSQWNISN